MDVVAAMHDGDIPDREITGHRMGVQTEVDLDDTIGHRSVQAHEKRRGSVEVVDRFFDPVGDETLCDVGYDSQLGHHVVSTYGQV